MTQLVSPLIVVAWMLLVSMPGSQGQGLSSVEFGMTMAARAYGLVCWYEKLKQFPHTSSDSYTRDCFGKADYVKNYIKDDDTGLAYFGEWLNKIAMGGLPTEYGHTCSEYLNEPDRPPSVNEGDALNDGEPLPYPFQGFSYCLIGQLRQKFGSKAIEAIRNEKTHSRKHWLTTILERENEFRARHGSQPMLLIKELTDAAQRWAEVNAHECRLFHSRNTDRERRWNGNVTGESLSAGPAMPDEDSAYVAADGWYEEIKDYPFPRGYIGKGNDMSFQRIGNFAQTVWRGTKYVGYGLAKNPNCEKYKYYLVARYSPAGNYVGQYQRNVLEPRDGYGYRDRDGYGYKDRDSRYYSYYQF